MTSPAAALRPIVHVHGGSALLERLRAAGLPGTFLEWCDPVVGGPTPRAELDAWYRLRAAYLAGEGGDIAKIEAGLRAQDQALREIPSTAEVVIWSGPELFCQAILMRLLVLLGERASRPVISLVDPGDLPGRKGCGLAQQTPQALADLFDHRRVVGEEAIDLAGRAWAAFTAPGAKPLVAFLKEDTSDLPHLAAALDRHLRDLPDGGTGLSTTETNVLEILAAQSVAVNKSGLPQEVSDSLTPSVGSAGLDRARLLSALADREPRPWLTDVLLDEILQRLTAGNGALVSRQGDAVTITQRGRDVLAGYEFWEAERWHGGIQIGAEDDDGSGASIDPGTLS